MFAAMIADAIGPDTYRSTGYPPPRLPRNPPCSNEGNTLRLQLRQIMACLSNIKRLIPAAALLCLAALAACSPDESGAGAPSAKQAGAGAMTRQVANAAPDTSGICPEGNDAGRRLNDLAEHVHDAAVDEYLLANVVDFGRTSRPQDRHYALMLLDDDIAYETCVAVPERCLRAELLRAESNAERDALLSSKGAYAYERALACLQRAGDAYASRKTDADFREADPVKLDAAYRERIIPHLIGHMMPVDALIKSNFYGEDNAEIHDDAVIAWHECHDSLASVPLDPEQLVQRTSHDSIAALECAWDHHAKTWGSKRPDEPTPTAAPTPN